MPLCLERQAKQTFCDKCDMSMNVLQLRFSGNFVHRVTISAAASYDLRSRERAVHRGLSLSEVGPKIVE